MKSRNFLYLLFFFAACGSASKNIAVGPAIDEVESEEAPENSVTIETFTGASPNTPVNTQNNKANSGQTIQWLDFETAIDLNTANKKFIFIDIYTDWCGWCKRMDNSTFMDPEVVQFINENFYAVKIDAESKEAIAYKEVLYESKMYGAKMYNELAVNLLSGKMSFPSYVVLSKREAKKGVIVGYQTSTQLLLSLEGLIK